MSVDLLRDILSGLLLAVGGFFAVSGGVGLIRFPDLYTRIHAAGLTDSAGAALMLLGLLVRVPDASVAVRLVLIMLVMLLTGPTSTHALARAAHRDGIPIWPEGGDRRR